MNWFLLALKKYAVFSGRSQRSEYWFYVLFYLIISIVLSVIDSLVFKAGSMGILGGVFALAMLVPSIAVAARRLHDTGRSGWWQLLALIPLIGAIILIVFLAQDTTPGENKYGPSPKGT
jgi:uncharacterized membrane protein YhaH (DUF805 family)